ncbi:hypothetical protein [Absidia glauca]|uniref:FAS1 domain-containing protein n=1 Tax=Absidia glauca TaxID=4829 RepID=A0A163K6Q8_ABSGL|nr:hypothetical protein [Absidia glauca]
MLVKTLLLAALGVVGTTAQLTNSTLFSILNTTQLSPSPKFIQLLQSSPDYKPVLDLLSQPGNFTLFVPSDAPSQSGEGGQGGQPSQSVEGGQGGQPSQSGEGGQGGQPSQSGQPSETGATNAAMPVMAAVGGGANDTIPGSGGDSTSSATDGGTGPTPTGGDSSNSTTGGGAGGGSSNSTTGGGGGGGTGSPSGNDTQQSSGQSVFPQGFSIFSNFTVVDILYYHILQERVLLQDQTNQTVLLNTMLTNQTADKFGYGMPIILNSNTTQQNSSSSSGTENGGGSGNGTAPGGNSTTPGGSSGDNSTSPTSGGAGNDTASSGDTGFAPQAASWISRIKQLMEAQSSSGGANASQSGGNSSETPVYWIGNGLSNANVTVHDIEASNGVLHVIDNVLIPPGNATNVFSNISDASALSEMIEQNPEVSQSLNNASNVTIFAPNDKGLCMVCIDQLGQDRWKGLVMNHVIEGIYYTTNFTSTGSGGTPMNLTTQAGESLPISSNSSGITLNDTIQIVTPNILFNGGVIHLIDKSKWMLGFIEPPQNTTVSNNGTAAGPSESSSAPAAASSTSEAQPPASTSESTVTQPTTEANPPQSSPSENPVGVEQPNPSEDPPPPPAYDNPFPPTYY